MEIHLWEPARHAPHVARWVGGPLDASTFPPETFVALVEGIPVAVAALYLTRSSLAFVDNVIADETAPPFVRARAVQRLIEHMHGEARLAGAQWMIGHTAQAGIHAVARRLGTTIVRGELIAGKV